MNRPWSLNDVTDQFGRIAIVTGANTGIGYETALALAGKGATVILACRNPQRAEEARRRILDRNPRAHLEARTMNMASLNSVREFADAFSRDHNRLDLLINNAGVMLTPHFLTEDGFEGHFGVNYLGHFLLTGLLLPTLIKTEMSRIVSLYSLAHDWNGIQFDDLQFEKQYQAKRAYAQSKMACLMFSLELNQRLHAGGYNTLCVAAHPGWAKSDGTRNMPTTLKLFFALVNRFLFQSTADGAQPTLYAALGSGLQGGEVVGPSGYKQRKGPPTLVDFSADALDQTQRARLWSLSEKLCNFGYPF